MVLGVAQYVNCAIAGDLLTRRLRATSAEITRLRAEAVNLRTSGHEIKHGYDCRTNFMWARFRPFGACVIT